MKTRNAMNPKRLMPLLLALLAAPALADEGNHGVFGVVIGPAIAQVAQFSPEERRAMRERWEQASPEERLQMRREFKERMRQMPPDPRRDMAEQWRNPPLPGRERPRAPDQGKRYREGNPDEASFGFGFERRRFENGRAEDGRVENPPPANIPYPGDFLDRRNPREINRDGRRADDRR